ncbi:DUF4142 domain-containing protein [Mucilaginibacter pallidiroseus]|uniref:DUF4142 domain-containing protein n=1 Tax=Mucilaginibacter pallidiroseus TaxID=2599295 RepID=A0A563TXA2_9SPHI|nr:DUF4142 domain-containing protein [Mucilaginibacter pallidiroseus]TWR23873.1 DUF4142 domain-containing protein [Mucilaginibacter pallidiroseus]
MKYLSNLLLAGLVVTAVSCKQKAENSSSTDAALDSNKKELAAKDSTELKDDAEFAVTAANGGMLEVELGKLAKTKAASAEVKQFADMMVTNHSKANKELMELAGAKVITLPAILSNDKQKDYDDMAKLSGSEFDKAYTDYMVKDHKEDIEEFKKEASEGKDAEFKAFAAKHVPILQHHLEMAEKAQAAVKK